LGKERRIPASWIIFGPDLEPLEAESRRQAEEPGPRRDGLLVAGAPGEVAQRLAEAARSSAGWCELQHCQGAGEEPEPVHVQVRHVRFVIADERAR
jgi:hypothetical protein